MNRPGISPLLPALLLAAVAPLGAPPLLAAVDGTMSGLVRDASGGPLPGVTVTIRAPVLQGARTAVTRADGTFRVPGLPPGAGYAATFALSGFLEARVPDLAVRLGLDTQVNPVLALASVAAEVSVTDAAPLVDTTQTNTGQTLGTAQLRELAVGARARTYQGIVGQVAGVRGSAGAEGLEYHFVLGGWINENSYLVDGVNATDPVNHYWNVPVGYESIQEISVQTSSFLPEYGRATAGVISLVTRSGGNEVHGALDVRSTSSDLSATGDYFDPDATPYRSTPWTASLGGPILKDTLWYHANVQRTDDVRTPYTADPVILAQVPKPADRRADGWNWGAKLSATASERLNGFVSFTSGATDTDNTYGEAAARPEAVTLYRNESELLSVKANGILSDRFFAEVLFGIAGNEGDFGPSRGDATIPAWVNRTGRGVRYDNNTFVYETDRPRTQLGLSASWFVPDLLGNHELKIGAEADRSKHTYRDIQTGRPSDPSFCSPEPGVRGAPPGTACGATILFNGFDAAGERVPWRQSLSESQAEFTQEGESLGVYLQDQWRPTPRLTVNIGFRWDRNEYFNNEGISVTALEKLQPRVSAAFDLTGDGRTAVRASWGLFYLDIPISLLVYANTGLTPRYYATYTWSATARRWSLIPGSEVGGMAAGVADVPAFEDGLKAMYEEGWSVALEREVARNLSVTATFLDRRSRELVDDTCVDYETCGYWVTTNWPGRSIGLENPMTRSYRGWILEAAWRVPGGRGLVTGSYVWSERKGSLEMTEDFGKSNDFDFYPYEFTNRYGWLSTDVRHQAKLFGSYRIPRLETTVAVGWTYRSGLPWTPWDYDPVGLGTVFVEPRGSRRTEPMHNVDLQLEQRFRFERLRPGLALSLFASVFNLFDDETPLGAQSWVGSPTFGQPTSYARPRSFELGARVEF